MIPREAMRPAVADVKSRDHYFGIDASGPGGLDSDFQELMIAFQLWDWSPELRVHYSFVAHY
jgi:hypothetical protein